MRLTLRTLLAYLDNTLDPADAQILKNKLTDSGFATSLVQRIRHNLDNPNVAAPSPDSVGPVDDANVISEYLDSTLPGEQVAEIERACLESDVLLTEAAACHQILSMALKTGADVPQELRERIYQLPDREVERIAAASTRFSSLAIDPPPPAGGSAAGGIFEDDLPTLDAPLEAIGPIADVGRSPRPARPATQSGHPVTPVGPADSGVSDAPTRIRKADGDPAVAPSRAVGAALAGSQPRSIAKDVIYGGGIRTSRITPWLVSLAVVAVLLFVLANIFAPLFDPPAEVAQVDTDRLADSAVGDELPADAEPQIEMLPPPEPVASVDSDGGDQDAGTDEMDDAEMLPAPGMTAQPVPDIGVEATLESDAMDIPMTDDFVEMAPPVPSSETPTRGVQKTAPEAPPSGAMLIEPLPPSGDVAALDVPMPDSSEVATITGEPTLIAAERGDGDWVRLKRDMTVLPGTRVVVAPSFRARMKSKSGFDVTLVGPAEASWLIDGQDQANPALVVSLGRILVTSSEPDRTLEVRLGMKTITLGFADVGSVAAASIKHFRAAGLDPLVPENRAELAGVLSVQGNIDVGSGGNQQVLSTGKQWVQRADADPVVSPVDAVPDWIDPPDPTVTSLRATAREGLLELIDGDQALPILLREATMFRRSEVAALAAESLLYLGQGDIYFGSDGILSSAKQRAYWPDHFLDLLATVDRSAESAEQLQASIQKMDAANVDSIFRLLTGFSQRQLVEGGDGELVGMLDAESMAVRVLALENLHKITGTTLYFRAEQDNAVRRQPGIKKWESRLRKGDIRWEP